MHTASVQIILGVRQIMPQLEVVTGWPAMSVEEAHRRIAAPGMLTEVEEAVVNGYRMKVWKNAPPTLRTILDAAREHGDKIFIVYEDECITYAAFHRATVAFARFLMDEGVTKGDRVAIIMRNMPEWIVAFYAATAIGAIATPLNAWWQGGELEYGLCDSGAKVAIVDSERYERLIPHLGNCQDLRRVVISRSPVDIEHPLAKSMESIIGPVDEWAELPILELPIVPLASDDDATIFYTSGTTGKPKGVLSTHRAVNTNIMAATAARWRACLRRGEPLPEPDPDAPQRIAMIAVPLFHVTGSMVVLNPLLLAGGKLVIMYKWDPVRAFELIEREKVQMAGGVPTIAWQLLEHPARADHDLSSLVNIAYGGAPASIELMRRLTEEFPGATPGQGYGMTETTAAVASTEGEDYRNRPESVGPTTPVSDIQIRDLADGRTVLPTGEIGELWAFGPMVAKGYWNNSQATAETFVDGWVRTGDLARIDDEGFCYIVDRAKDVLIRGGENIYCPEVENVLYEHPLIGEVAVLGRPHPMLGEEPVAIVMPKPGQAPTEDELKAHVASRLAQFKVPVAIYFRTDPLPRNATGKILKSELKHIFAEEGQASAPPSPLQDLERT
jgi:long-chain acyl-CoA synthetase